MNILQRLILILLLFYQVDNIFSDQQIKITEYIPPSNQPFDISYWCFRINEYKDIRIKFLLSEGIDKENKFIILQIVNTHYEDIGYGTYLIKNGIIDSIKIIECKNKVSSIITNQKIKLYYTDQDLEDDYYLLFNDSKIKLWGSTFRYSGTERKVGDIPVIIVLNNGYTTENAKIRTYPLLGNNTVKYIDKNNNELDYVPKDTYLYVYARTKNKYQVGQWNNYWYLVSHIRTSKPAVDLVQTKYIWIFAEFVKYEEILNLYNDTTSYPTGFPYD